MRLQGGIEVLREVAPEGLAESWDKVGLHVGDPGRAVRRGMLCIDLTEAVLEEAVAARVGLIVASHPPIFEPLSAVTTQQAKQRLVLRAARRNATGLLASLASTPVSTIGEAICFVSSRPPARTVSMSISTTSAARHWKPPCSR